MPIRCAGRSGGAALFATCPAMGGVVRQSNASAVPKALATEVNRLGISHTSSTIRCANVFDTAIKQLFEVAGAARAACAEPTRHRVDGEVRMDDALEDARRRRECPSGSRQTDSLIACHRRHKTKHTAALV
jgi:hypothetical protein